MDQVILDKQFFHILVANYHLRIQEHKVDFSYLPKRISENFEDLKDSESYGRLLECIAQWYALMELCEDLVDRV